MYIRNTLAALKVLWSANLGHEKSNIEAQKSCLDIPWQNDSAELTFNVQLFICPVSTHRYIYIAGKAFYSIQAMNHS